MTLISYYRDIYQIGYVARDLEKAMALLKQKMGVKEFITLEPDLMVTVAGEQRPMRMRVALANIGGKQIEVIQPVSGAVDLYLEGVDFDRSNLVFHHIGIAVPGPVSAWATVEEEVHASGDVFAVSFAGSFADFEARFAYVDTRSQIGHFTEYLWWSNGVAAGNAYVPENFAPNSAW